MSNLLVISIGINIISMCINYITNDTNGIIANGLAALILLKIYEQSEK